MDIQIIIFYIFQIIKFLIIARVFLSWVPINVSYKVKQFIYDLTEPLMSPFRSLIPAHKIGVDLSPMFVLLSLQILQSLLI
tara:strand:- start:459 stop:701 length:243 start_codon:yes stop_codon:yes gene_type:complete